MRMIFEHLRSRLMRSGANDREGADCVGDIGNPLLVDLLGLAERAAHLDEGSLMFFHPCLPRRDAA